MMKARKAFSLRRPLSGRNSRGASEIVRRMVISAYTWDGRCAWLRVWESDRPTWYRLDETSVRAILLNQYGYEPRSGAIITEAVHLLLERAKRSSRRAGSAQRRKTGGAGRLVVTA